MTCGRCQPIRKCCSLSSHSTRIESRRAGFGPNGRFVVGGDHRMARKWNFCSQTFRTSAAAMAVMAATLVSAQFAVSEARAIGVHAPPTASSAHACFITHVSVKATAVGVPAKTPTLRELSNRKGCFTALAHVRLETSLAPARLQSDEIASIVIHQFVSILRDSVDPLVVLPGTPPPSPLG